MIVCLVLIPGVTVTAAEDLSVLPEKIDNVLPSNMMSHYLRRLAGQKFEDWKTEYEQRKTPEQIAEYQKRLREKFIEAIGGLPERTGLNPQVTGIVSRDGYRVEKIIFESQPKHYVSALLFLPETDKFDPPYPGVLVPCGHSANGKAHDAYQTMGALLALNRMAGLEGSMRGRAGETTSVGRGAGGWLIDRRASARLGRAGRAARARGPSGV